MCFGSVKGLDHSAVDRVKRKYNFGGWTLN